ncbi:hypothetical protein SAMN04487821_12764 [Enterococcus malodoratus]|nr:hypothetical protein SAMN04487821_12764 [Enterococcus malodoratus]
MASAESYFGRFWFYWFFTAVLLTFYWGVTVFLAFFSLHFGSFFFCFVGERQQN